MLVSYNPRPHGLLKEGGTRKFSNIMLSSFDKDYLINFFPADLRFYAGICYSSINSLCILDAVVRLKLDTNIDGIVRAVNTPKETMPHYIEATELL